MKQNKLNLDPETEWLNGEPSQPSRAKKQKILYNVCISYDVLRTVQQCSPRGRKSVFNICTVQYAT